MGSAASPYPLRSCWEYPPRVDELWRLVAVWRVARGQCRLHGRRANAIIEYIQDVTDNVTGFRFLRQELLELSLVTVPANPNALALAKSLVC